MNVYHFTNCVGLPHIIHSGELRPGSNKIGGFPDPDFIWATLNRLGDKTSFELSPISEQAGSTLRFTLPMSAFFPWSEAPSQISGGSLHLERLESTLKGASNPRQWFCHNKPLSEAEWVTIETKSYTTRWRKLESREIFTSDEGFTGVEIGGGIHFSRKIKGPQGQDGYELGKTIAHPA